MPRGTRHQVVGRLNHDAHGWRLRVDGGGTWRLEFGIFVGLRARRLAGRRVAVRGTRDGFDLLAVERIEQVQVAEDPL